MKIQQSMDFRVKRQMTRSAPPERNVHAKSTSGSGRHTAYPRAQKPRTSDISSISVEDIYQFAERERLNYSTNSRRQNLAHAQSQTQFFRHEQQVVVSRPNTSASRHINSSRRETNTPMSAWSEPQISRPSSIIPHPELRDLLENDEGHSDDDDYRFDMSHQTPMTVTFSPVSRDCCEIIGPQLCYECRKNRIRAVSKQRSEIYFPTLDPSEENLTTAAIVRKYLPGLSEPEIETRIARGEIAKPSMLRKQNRQIDFSDEETETKPKHTNKKVTIIENSKDKKENSPSVTLMKPNDLFFTNIRDLNNKIITGNVERNIGFSNVVKREVQRVEKNHWKSHFPTFVSPKKVTMVQQTHYKTYFDPPLIEKAKQDVEPAFFAGSKLEYVLPEKLPDELVFIDKDGNEVKASASESFVSKVSVTQETGKKNSKTKSAGNTVGTDIGKTSGVDSLASLKEDEEEGRSENHLEKLNEESEEEEEENPSFLSTGESEIEHEQIDASAEETKTGDEKLASVE